jgi:cyclic pyranopterin phosphate synthase
MMAGKRILVMQKGLFGRGLSTAAAQAERAAGVAVMTDNFGRVHNYLRMSLTEKCNFRCQYCMPAEGVDLTPKPQLMTADERKRTLQLFGDVGVTKVRFTGGEPTLSRDLEGLVRYAANMPGIQSVGMTTNGFHLTEKVQGLKEAGLTSVNISLDTLDPTKFATLTRRRPAALRKVLASVYATKAAGMHNVKINCVLMKGVNDDEVPAFLQLGREAEVDVRFIEFMPFSGNNWEAKQQLIPYKDVLNGLHAEGIHLEALQSPDPHDTTKWFTQPDVNPTSSKVGFITSMSQHFCGACNRVRITADGRFRSCLFGKESDGFSLTEAFRSGSTDADLYGLVGGALGKKHASLGGHTVEKLGEEGMSDRPMILIGG